MPLLSANRAPCAAPSIDERARRLPGEDRAPDFPTPCVENNGPVAAPAPRAAEPPSAPAEKPPKAHPVVLDALLVIATAIVFLVAGGVALHRSEQAELVDRVAGDFATFKSEFRDHFSRAQTPAAPATGDGPASARANFVSRIEPGSPAPAGGSYRWEAVPATNAAPGQRPALRARIAAYAPDEPLEFSRRDLRAIDRRIDDGNLETGEFRVGFGGWPELVVRQPH